MVGTRLPSVAVITMCRDEAALLPRWVAHYSAQVGVDHLYVLDDHSTDGSTQDVPCVVLPAREIEGPFEPARMLQLNELASKLLVRYDAVIATDVDELVLADPSLHASLRHFVAARDHVPVLAPMALNVLHRGDREPPLDASTPVLSQRRAAQFVQGMCKPMLKSINADWVFASHGIESPFVVDPELWMFHLKFADRGQLAASAAHRKRLFDEENRGAAATWSQGEEIVRALDEITADAPDEPEEFVPPMARLRRVPREVGAGVWRASGRPQLKAMRANPVVSIPKRFAGAL